MRVGRVIGRVVLSQKVDELPTGRWLLVSPLGRTEAETPEEVRVSPHASPVVFDDMGAGYGDLIGFTEGGEAMRPFDRPVPVDAYDCCILDSVEVLDKETDS